MSFLYSKKIKRGKIIYKFLGIKIQFKIKKKKIWREKNKHNFMCIGNVSNPNNIVVGKYSYGSLNVEDHGIGNEKLYIGNFCSIGPNVNFILASEHSYKGFSTYPFKVKFLNQDKEARSKGDIILGDDVWVGMRCIILSGIKIGQGAIIAAGSVVTKDVEPYAIVGGSPAKLIKYRFSPEIISKMLKFDFSTLSEKQIIKNQEVLYDALNEANIDIMLKKLTENGCN